MPIIVIAMLSDLIREIDEHLAWRKAQGCRLADSTFGMKVVRDSKFLPRLRAGGGITVATMQAVRDWMAEDRKSGISAVQSGRAA